MTESNAERPSPGATARFRVSDALRVPLRGYMLRLRLLEGRPDVKALGAGKDLRLQGPAGATRIVRINDIAVTSGRATQERLERTGELDVIISEADATGGGEAVEIGWMAEAAGG